MPIPGLALNFFFNAPGAEPELLPRATFYFVRILIIDDIYHRFIPRIGDIDAIDHIRSERAKVQPGYLLCIEE